MMPNRLFRILSLARIIIIEGIRRYALIGLIVFALAGEAGGLLFFDFIPRDIGRASNDFLFSICWVAGLVFLLFHAVRASAWDEGRGVIHTFLARPISRTEYVIGVFAGLTILLLLLNLILGSIGWVLLNFIKSSVKPLYFEHLSLSCYVLSLAGLYCIEFMILSVILLFSAAIRGSFPVLLLTLSYYFICSGLPVVRDVLKDPKVAETTQGLGMLLKWMTAIFPDFSRLDFKMLVTVADNSLVTNEIFSIFGLSILYVVIVLWFASLIYQRRDLV
jgi:hypothetical protein